VHLQYGKSGLTEIIPVSVCREELETRCETESGANERASEREKRRERERERMCVCACERFPRVRGFAIAVYSRQFGERNRKRALSRERDSGFNQAEMKKEEEREKRRKGSLVRVGVRPW